MYLDNRYKSNLQTAWHFTDMFLSVFALHHLMCNSHWLSRAAGILFSGTSALCIMLTADCVANILYVNMVPSVCFLK